MTLFLIHSNLFNFNKFINIALLYLNYQQYQNKKKKLNYDFSFDFWKIVNNINMIGSYKYFFT